VEALALYRRASECLAVLMFPLTGTVAVFSTELLFAWTGDRVAAGWAGPILFWFVLGTGFYVVGGLQYMLQFAYGKVRLHVILNTFLAAVQVPVVIFVVLKHGAMGAAVAWFGLRLLTVLIWPPIVHHRFAPGIHRKWLVNDIGPSLVLTVLLLGLAKAASSGLSLGGRLETAAALVGIGTVVLLSNVLLSRAPLRLVDSVLGHAKESLSRVS
jgi:O-antigen/teichoic acid export membrane protein